MTRSVCVRCLSRLWCRELRSLKGKHQTVNAELRERLKHSMLDVYACHGSGMHQLAPNGTRLNKLSSEDTVARSTWRAMLRRRPESFQVGTHLRGVRDLTEGYFGRLGETSLPAITLRCGSVRRWSAFFPRGPTRFHRGGQSRSAFGSEFAALLS